MKKKLSLILALVMVLTIIPFTSFAETNYDKQLKEAITKSKELFNIGKEYDEFNQSVSTSEGKTIFYLNWSSSQEDLGNINVSITMDGTILNYGKWDPSYGKEKPSLPSISREEGLEKAKEFIKKVSPKLAGKIKYIDTKEPLNINDNIYRYKFVRMENDVPYYNNEINLALNTSKGEVQEYSTRWDWDIKFAEKSNIIPLEKAKELYKEKIGLELIYKTSYSDRKPKMFLVYGPLNEDIGINAKDGEIAPIYRYYPIYGDGAGMEAAEDEAMKNELSPDELKAIEDIGGLISDEEAEKVGREILEIDAEYLTNSVNLYSDWRNDDEYLWEMSFTKKINSKEEYASVSIDAKTKKLLNYYHEKQFDMDGEAKFNKEESLEIAKEFIEKFNKEDYESLELRKDFMDENNFQDGKMYNFQFIRKVNNEYVDQDGVSITVDAINGRVSQYSLNWNKEDFPPMDNLISLDKAYSILFNEVGIELKYTSKESYGMEAEKDKEAILVYALKNKPATIDAKTGTILNYNGKPYKETIIADYKDIENSYAKEKIKTLARYGIFLPGENFKPKEEIKQKDFLYLLAKAKYPYFDVDESMDNMYKHLINEGIVKAEEKSTESIVTKEEGVKYIVRAMDYSKIAGLKEIYKDLFADTEDIDPELKGHMSIAYGLKIISAEDNKINPKLNLKREDGASMIYNYLFGEM